MKVIVLDHAGRRSAATVPAKDGAFMLDGAQTKSCYYLVEYE